MPLPTVPDTDDRRTCAMCEQLASNGLCLAARTGQIVASRTYQPDAELLRRCEGYKPNRTDADQRPGRQRWPNLTTKSKGECKK